MARPTKKLTENQKTQVEALAAYLSTEQIADYFGISRSTFFAMMEREPDIAALYKKGKAKAVGSIAQSLLTKARAGDNACMMFYLKTQAGWRETSRHELVGDEGGPIDTTMKVIFEDAG